MKLKIRVYYYNMILKIRVYYKFHDMVLYNII